jgi:hypothetical protein
LKREGLILRKLEGQNVSAGPLKPMGARRRGVRWGERSEGDHVKEARQAFALLFWLTLVSRFHEVTAMATAGRGELCNLCNSFC